MSELIDIAEGIKTKWAATSALTTLIPASRLVQTKQSGQPTLPYARFTITRDKEPEYVQPRISGSPYICHYKVKFEVWAATVGTSLEAVMDAIVTAFATEFTVPNSTHLSWTLEGQPGLEEEKDRRDAGAVNRGDIEYTSMLQRAHP